MTLVHAIELFGCAGGMAEGFRRAGIQFAASFDADPIACESYEYNLPGHAPILLDVRNLQRITRLFGARAGQLDLVVADPPCTPWSRAGKRQGLADKRDMLGVTVELLEAWRPRCWLIGNVPGLDDSTNALALQRTFTQLARHYCIDYASLDAAAYGVPQHRVRPFWFGHPRGSQCIRWPESTHGPARRQLQIAGTELLPYVTVRDALQHLPRRKLGRPIQLRWKRTRQGHPPSRADHPAGTIMVAQPNNGGNVLSLGTDHRPSRADRPARTLTRNTHGDGALLVNDKHPVSQADAPSRGVRASDGGGATGARCVAWPWDRPSTVVTARDEVPRYGRNGRHDSQSHNAIKLSELAAAILQGFPENWQFAGKTKRARWSQIGQAMPPPLAAAVAERIVAWFYADDAECTSPGVLAAGHRL